MGRERAWRLRQGRAGGARAQWPAGAGAPGRGGLRLCSMRGWTGTCGPARPVLTGYGPPSAGYGKAGIMRYVRFWPFARASCFGRSGTASHGPLTNGGCRRGHARLMLD